MTSTPPPPDPRAPTGDQSVPPQPGWTPAPLSSGVGAGFSAPTTPSASGPERVPSSEIGRYAPRRSLVPLVIAAIGVAIAVVVGYTALHPSVPAPVASPSHRPSTATKPTPRDGVPFTAEYDNATGVWKIAESRWDATGLSAFIVVSVDSGVLDCSFDALPHDGQEVADGKQGSLSPGFPSEPIAAGSSGSGWVHFDIVHGTTLVFLQSNDQPQISGIEVAG
jgi:hypothetical protein